MSSLLRLAVVSAATALASAGLATAITSAAPAKLYGTVGPGYTIRLKNAQGKRVTTVKAGRYTFVVNDRSVQHSFDLKRVTGACINGGLCQGTQHRTITGVLFVGKRTVMLTLTKGKWQ